MPAPTLSDHARGIYNGYRLDPKWNYIRRISSFYYAGMVSNGNGTPNWRTIAALGAPVTGTAPNPYNLSAAIKPLVEHLLVRPGPGSSRQALFFEFGLRSTSDMLE